MEKENPVWNHLAKKVGFKHSATINAFLRQLDLCVNSPTGASTQIAGRSSNELPWSEAMSTYRFMENEKASLKNLRDFRREITLSDYPVGNDILVMNDISLLDYSQHNSKKDRRKIGNGRGRGYEYTCNLAVNPTDGSVLGTIHDCLVNSDGPDDLDMVDYSDNYLKTKLKESDLEKIKTNHRHQMVAHIRASTDMLKPWNPIHVGDREFDDILIMLAAMDEDHDFVIRATNLRNVQTPNVPWLPEAAHTGKQSGHALKDGHVYTKVSSIVEHIPLAPYKNLPLDGKGRVTTEQACKRKAELHIGSVPISLYRQVKRNQKYLSTPRAADVNLVIIKELIPPEGAEPLCWILLTNREVDSPEQMAYAGYIYELRWKIEEYFRILKSLYRLEKVRYNSASKVARYLVLITIAAQMLFKIKDLAGINQSAVLNDEEFTKVRHAMRNPDQDEIDINLRLFALIAKRGGWLGRRRDPIGPTILARGMMDVLAVLQIQQEHQKLLTELQTSPQYLFKFGQG